MAHGTRAFRPIDRIEGEAVTQPTRAELRLPTCQSLREDETPCGAPATKVVRGRPGYLWRGVHCDACADRVSKMFDHQGGCVVESI